MTAFGFWAENVPASRCPDAKLGSMSNLQRLVEVGGPFFAPPQWRPSVALACSAYYSGSILSPAHLPLCAPTPKVLDADLPQSAFVTSLNAEPALDCAVALAHGLNVGRWGAPIELNEACSSVG